MNLRNLNAALLFALFAIACQTVGAARLGQGHDALTPIQRAIERERQRLSSVEIEDRRDALMRLGKMKRPEASRVAANGLTDPAPLVRVTVAHALLSLPADEAARLLIPLLQDKQEFVRRETAYVLGET